MTLYEMQGRTIRQTNMTILQETLDVLDNQIKNILHGTQKAFGSEKRKFLVNKSASRHAYLDYRLHVKH